MVDNMIDGFDIYSLPRTTPVHHFEVPTNKKYVKKAAFAEKGQTVVGGSDHGQVYVFAIDNSQAEQVLIHGKKDNMIQSVEVRTINSLTHTVKRVILRRRLHVIITLSGVVSLAGPSTFKSGKNRLVTVLCDSVDVLTKRPQIKEVPRQRRNFDLGFLILMNFVVILVAWTAHSWRPVIEAVCYMIWLRFIC